jgi:RNA polymerase sigma factor (sigma-70 family)
MGRCRTASQFCATRQGLGVDDLSDEELLAAARRDPEAFAAFYRRHARAVAGFFVARTRDAETAADLTAETFAAALEGVGRYRPDRGAATAWLYGIARHQLSRWQRRRAVDDRARRRLGMERLVLDDEDVERVGALGVSEAAAVRVWVEELPANQRVALRARVVEGDDYAELAERTGSSEAAVRQRVSRGLSALRARWSREMP